MSSRSESGENSPRARYRSVGDVTDINAGGLLSTNDQTTTIFCVSGMHIKIKLKIFTENLDVPEGTSGLE